MTTTYVRSGQLQVDGRSRLVEMSLESPRLVGDGGSTLSGLLAEGLDPTRRITRHGPATGRLSRSHLHDRALSASVAALG